MCARCNRDANFIVSSLIFVLGKSFLSPSPAVRPALLAFVSQPSDERLQDLVRALDGRALAAQVRGVAEDVRTFGGLDAVLAAADREHQDNFRAAMKAIGGDDE